MAQRDDTSADKHCGIWSFIPGSPEQFVSSCLLWGCKINGSAP